MRTDKQERLEAKGWKVGSIQEFLGLSPEEVASVELRLKVTATSEKKREDESDTD